MIDTNQSYVPGVCNINHAEIASRRKAGHFGLALFIVLGATLLVIDANRFVRLLLFVPAFIAAIGYLQAKNKFCVGYGAAGMQNAAPDSASAQAVTDHAAKRSDAARARKMNLQATTIAVVATAVLAILP